MVQMMRRFIGFVALALLAGCATTSTWEQAVDERIPEYGHRNWIVVADSAYPKQSAPGIETIYTDAGQVEVLKQVLQIVDAADHIRPVIMLDAELDYVKEEAVPGVEVYRNELKKIFGDRQVKVMPHEEIIGKLDEGAKLFNILLLKTDMMIPYTSVFIELDCGYWNADKEAELRRIITR